MKFACLLPEWAKTAEQRPESHRNSGLNSATPHCDSEIRIVSAGRSNWGCRRGGAAVFWFAGIQEAAQAFIAYETGMRWPGSTSQPSALLPGTGGVTNNPP